MSKSKKFITTSAVILSMVTPVVGTVSNLGTVFAEDNSTSNTSSESVDAKLQRATDVRDVAHKEFVDATVEYTLANRVKIVTDADKKTAEDNLAKAEEINTNSMSLLEASMKAISEAQKNIIDQNNIIEKAENRIANLNNVNELATNKLNNANAQKDLLVKDIEKANKIIDSQKSIISLANKSIENAKQSKIVPTSDIEQFQKLLLAAQEDLKTATSANSNVQTDGSKVIGLLIEKFNTGLKNKNKVTLSEAVQLLRDYYSDNNIEINHSLSSSLNNIDTFDVDSDHVSNGVKVVVGQLNALKYKTNLSAIGNIFGSSDSKKQAEGNIKTFETAIKQAQAKIDAADKIITDSESNILNAKNEISAQSKIVDDKTKILNSTETIISEQTKAIKDNIDLISVQNENINKAKHILDESNEIINKSTLSKTNAEKTISDNASVIKSAKDVLAEVTKIAKTNNDKFESAKTRLDKAEKDLQVKQAAVDALRAESVKEKANVTPSEKTESKTDTKESEKPKSDTVTVKVKNVDTDGKVLSETESKAKMNDNVTISKVDGYDVVGAAFASAKSAADVDVAKGFVASEDGTLTVVHRKQSTVVKPAENKVEDKTIDNNANKPSDNKTEDKTSANKSDKPADNKVDDKTTDNNVNKSTDNKSEDKTSDNKSSDNKTEDTSAKTTVDGVITQMKFDKITENEVHFSGMIDKSKLTEGQKLEGDYAKVVVTSGDGSELGSFNVRDDYKFDGILKSTPKDGETLIVKYGGKNYELPYGLTKADNNQQAQTDNSASGQKATDGATKEKRDVKASLLPSTGQQSPIGIAIAGILMVILGAVALFMKFRNKKSEE